MNTMSFGEAMSGFSDVLYTRAMEHIADRHKPLVGAPGLRANAHSRMTFDVTLGSGGLAEIAVSRYCAGFALDCTAWIETPDPSVKVAGSIRSNDGGGTEFTGLEQQQRLQFELQTSFWRSTTFTVRLSTTPALPEGTVLTVCMEIDY